MWIDWFSGYIGIMIEHQLAHGTEHDELSEYLFCVNFQTTVGFRVIHSFHFLHLWVHRTVNYVISPIVRNLGLSHLLFASPVGRTPSSLCNRSFQIHQNPCNSGN